MNQIIIIGHIGADATADPINDKFVIKFSVATTEKFGDKSRTDWHQVKWWVSGDKVLQYLTKGTKVAIQGRQRNEKYEDKYFSYINADKVELLGSKKDEE